MNRVANARTYWEICTCKNTHMRSIIYITLLLIHLFLAAFAHGQADTIRPGKGHLMTEILKPGLRQYLVYFQNPRKADRLGFWYWMRDIKIDTKDGKQYFAISQHWYGGDSLSYRQAYSLNRRSDFAPIYHSEMVRGKTKAYDWSGQGITGADTVAFTAPNFNWNLDIETFEMLPLAAGKSFLINFYDAGLEPPKYVLYTVTGSEELTVMNGEKIDCWMLFTKGESPRGPYTETYWISKKTHEFLKEEDDFGSMYRYKVKMPGMAPDLLPRWVP